MALCAVLAGVAVAALFRRSRVTVGATWLACTALVIAAFPLHLLFQIPAAVIGRPTDARDLVNRLVLLVDGLLFGAAASAATPSRSARPGVDGPRPVPSPLSPPGSSPRP